MAIPDYKATIPSDPELFKKCLARPEHIPTIVRRLTVAVKRVFPAADAPGDPEIWQISDGCGTISS